MNSLSSRQWTCALLAALVLLVMVCSAGLAVVIGLQIQSGLDRTAAVDAIAYVGVDGNIYTVNRQGEDRLALTGDAEVPTRAGGRLYRFPTWSPDNRWIAFVGLEVNQGQPPTNTLYAATASGDDEPTPLFSSQESGPFYLDWSPDASRLAFLSNEDSSLALRMASLSGETRLLDTGDPFYFTWGPDNETLITHVGGSGPASRIERLELGAAEPETLSSRPAAFQAPAWSPTGDAVLFATELNENEPALYLANDRGEPQQALVRYEGAISFAWSPQGDRVAYIITNRSRPAGLEQFAFGQIQVIERDGDAARTVSVDEAIAFFWAPDGRKIAYLSVVIGPPLEQGRQTLAGMALQQNQLHLEWHVVDLRTDEDATLTTFVPAPGFVSLIPFFDQYVQSLSLWSPDSTALVYSALGVDEVSKVWVVAVNGQTAAQRVADGDLPAWSWK